MSRQGDLDNRHAAERYDTLEDTLPTAGCQARGCHKLADYEWAGQWGVFWLCPEHRRMYVRHDRIVSRIHNLPKKRYTG